MAILGAKIARSAPTVELAAYGIDDASMQWLEDRLGTRRPKASAVDSLARSSLTPQEQRFMGELLTAMRGGGRDVSVSVTQRGAGDAQRAGFMQATLQPKTRDAAVVGRVRAALEAVLWGQESHLEAFCTIARDHVSETRTLAAVLVLGGNRGHGKTEALAALANGLFANADSRVSKGGVHVVDLSAATDASAAALFDEEGPLGDKTLKQLVGRSIVCFTGAQDLQARAPRVAQLLQALLGTSRHEKGYRSLVYAFDFDQSEDSPIKAMSQALGPVGTRIASAYADFDDLDAATMQRYCLARLPRLLKSKALGDIRVDLDEAALSLLGAALATPHMPIEELDARAYQLILSHLEVADGGSRGAPTLVQMTAAADPEEAAAIIENLTSPLPDITLAKKLLRVVQVVVEAGAESVKAPAESHGAPKVEARRERSRATDVAEIHADVVARARNNEAMFASVSGKYDAFFRKLLAGMRLASEEESGVDLNEALNFVLRETTRVESLDADAAIALLASVAPVDFDQVERYASDTIPRPVAVALGVLERVGEATADELVLLTTLADKLIRNGVSVRRGQPRLVLARGQRHVETLSRLLSRLAPKARHVEEKVEASEPRKITVALSDDIDVPGYELKATGKLGTDGFTQRRVRQRLREAGNLEVSATERLTAIFELMKYENVEAIPAATAIALLDRVIDDLDEADLGTGFHLQSAEGRLEKYPDGFHPIALFVALEALELASNPTREEVTNLASRAAAILQRLPLKDREGAWFVNSPSQYAAMLHTLAERKRS